MVFAAKIFTGPNGKFYYEVGHFNAAGQWEPDIISGPLFTTEQKAEDAAHCDIRMADRVLRANRRRHFQRDAERRTHGAR
jgi:hypothetical protein